MTRSQLCEVVGTECSPCQYMYLLRTKPWVSSLTPSPCIPVSSISRAFQIGQLLHALIATALVQAASLSHLDCCDDLPTGLSVSMSLPTVCSLSVRSRHYLAHILQSLLLTLRACVNHALRISQMGPPLQPQFPTALALHPLCPPGCSPSGPDVFPLGLFILWFLIAGKLAPCTSVVCSIDSFKFCSNIIQQPSQLPIENGNIISYTLMLSNFSNVV